MSQGFVIPYIKLSKDAVAPVRKGQVAGFDLASVEDLWLFSPMFAISMYALVVSFATVVLITMVGDGFRVFSFLAANVLAAWITSRIPLVRKVNAGIAMEICAGHYGSIRDRSSMALKGISVGGGVVDENYRGPAAVILRSTNWAPYRIKKGDNIAQMIVEKYLACQFIEATNLSESERGTAGFGSTGR